MIMIENIITRNDVHRRTLHLQATTHIQTNATLLDTNTKIVTNLVILVLVYQESACIRYQETHIGSSGQTLSRTMDSELRHHLDSIVI